MRKSPLALLIVAGPVVVLVASYWLTSSAYRNRPVEIPSAGPVTIALAGDVLLTGTLDAAARDAGFTAVRDIVRGADFATANLEMNLLGREEQQRAELASLPRWPFGSERDARTLRQLGFDAIALANDHAGDYGPDGTASTVRILDAAGLLHAGAGLDLAKARAPVFAGRRIAFLSVAASSLPESRATRARADIAGRPGVSPLRYTADITVDAATFQTLKESSATLTQAPAPSELRGTRVEKLEASERELLMFGTPIKKGDRTSVQFIVDAEDERAVLDEIKAARAAAEIVVVSVHSHEPANASEQPADFIRRFARAAIDNGATLVVGHGPHRVRGLETYKDGAILYSLGNFLYQASGLDFRAANLYDAGADLYQAAVGALGDPPPGRETPPADAAWWESVLAVATVEGGRLTQIRLHPLDLGADKSQGEKGMPRMPDERLAHAILSRLAALSNASASVVQVEEGIGVVRVTSPNQTVP